MIISQCELCGRGFNEMKCNCSAFPEKIPYDILFNQVSHQKPFEGDNGITFLPLNEDCAEEIKEFEFGKPDPDSPPA